VALLDASRARKENVQIRLLKLVYAFDAQVLGSKKNSGRGRDNGSFMIEK
jgi:hypothetical protein